MRKWCKECRKIKYCKPKKSKEMRNETELKEYFKNAKIDVVTKLEELVKCYDDWMEIYEVLDIPAPTTYTVDASKGSITMNDVFAGTVMSNVLCTQFRMALYNLIKHKIYKQGFTYEELEITEIELSKEVENTSRLTRKYKPYLTYDIFKFEVMGVYSNTTQICTERLEDSQLGGGSGHAFSRSQGTNVVRTVLKFIKHDLLPKYKLVDHIVESDSHYIM